MAFDFITEIAPGGKVFKSTARIYTDLDGNVCDEDKAAFLLVGEGGELPWETAVKAGLVHDEDTVPVVAESVVAETIVPDVSPVAPEAMDAPVSDGVANSKANKKNHKGAGS